jgi:hypothetical protein
VLSLLVAVAVAIGDTLPVATDTVPLVTAAVHRPADAPADTVRRRHSVELSDWYYRRLEIHRLGSYIELPMFAGEYYLGNRLMANGQPIANWLRPAHLTVAMGLGGLFTINTVTGGWNLLEGWSQEGDRRNLIVAHTVLMLAADGGFAAAGAMVGRRSDLAAQRRHRAVAVASISAATVSTVMMWIARK